jgi:hypothetical protein
VTRRERRRFLALVEDTVHPRAPLPPVSATDAAEAFDRWLRSAPLLHRAGVRLLLLAKHDVARRLAAQCYYGDAAVMRLLGYDAEAVLRRAAEARS